MKYNHYIVYLLILIESLTSNSANISTNISNTTNISTNINNTTTKVTSSASKLRTIYYHNNWFYDFFYSFS